MMPVPRGCPADIETLAEAYVLNRLAEIEATEFELHYTGCPRCAAAVEDMRRYVEAMQEAARGLPRLLKTHRCQQ